MNATENSFIAKELKDERVRGVMDLGQGELAVVMDGGRVLVGKSLRLLDEFQSQALLDRVLRENQSVSYTLDAVVNVNGPNIEDRLSTRRIETQKIRDRGFATDAEPPEFVMNSTTLAEEGRLDPRTKQLWNRRRDNLEDSYPEAF